MGPYAYYRLRTPDGTAVSARVEPGRPQGGVYLAVGGPVRAALTRDEAHATMAVLANALDLSLPPEWVPVVIEPTDANGKPLDGVR
jgi:hypothetical protein